MSNSDIPCATCPGGANNLTGKKIVTNKPVKKEIKLPPFPENNFTTRVIKGGVKIR